MPLYASYDIVSSGKFYFRGFMILAVSVLFFACDDSPANAKYKITWSAGTERVWYSERVSASGGLFCFSDMEGHYIRLGGNVVVEEINEVDAGIGVRVNLAPMPKRK